MSCNACETKPDTTYVRVDTANVEIRGCPDHLRKLINIYRDALIAKPANMNEFSDMVRGYYRAGIESEPDVEKCKGMTVLAAALMRALGQEL